MEMAGPVSSAPRTVEDIYKDYAGRRAGLVRALTSGNVEDNPSPSLPYSPSPSAILARASSPDLASHTIPVSFAWLLLLLLCRCGRVLRHVRPR